VILGAPWLARTQAERDLAQSGLPRDLYDYQSQLIELDLRSPISNLEWLHTNRLQSLSVNSPALRAAKGLPPTLVHLVLTNSKITSLAGLEKLLQLTKLNLSSNRSLQSLAGLEKLQRLTTLDLSHNDLQNLAGLEKLRTNCLSFVLWERKTFIRSPRSDGPDYRYGSR
jgi:hypothetical protein